LLRDELKDLVVRSVKGLVDEGRLPAEALDVPVEISDTKSPDHGDYACNFAMVATKKVGLPPRQIGELLREALGDGREAVGREVFRSIEIAGPGFINFRLDPTYVSGFIGPVLEKGTAYVRPQSPTPNAQRLNVEFVSVNPNGPITVGSGRGAAFGSTLCNVLEAAGHEVHREYYINDGVNSEQMRLFAESVEALAEGREVPEKGYKGDYIKDIAEVLLSQGIPTQPSDQLKQSWFRNQSQEMMIIRQRGDLGVFGVEFDIWFSEQSLHDRGEVDRRITELEAKGVADTEPYRTVLKMGKGGKIDSVERVEQPNEEVDDEFGTEAPPPPAPSSSADAPEEGVPNASTPTAYRLNPLAPIHQVRRRHGPRASAKGR
jgi:arginyl-tRNA synthetase